jgi:hypothetical protein
VRQGVLVQLAFLNICDLEAAMKRFRALVRFLFAILAVFAFATVGFAQTITGSFRGSVTDQSGGAVVGATVKMTNSATGVSRETTTGADGDYVFRSVPSGSYDFRTSFAGFETTVTSGVTLVVNQDGVLDFVLHTGSVSQQVTVTAQAELVNTVNSTVGTVIENQEVVQLPLNGRQFTQLILLTPGSANMSSGQHSVFELNTDLGAVSPPVNGARAEMNNYTIDGVSNNELFLNFSAFSPPPDAILEFKVQTNISSAAFGRAAGANVNLITRSGGNEFHGDAWEFFRNTVLDAKSFFNPNRSVFHQNQFGFTLGGPIRKDKIWAFGYYEGFRKILGQNILERVPTQAELNGDLSAFAQIYNPYTTHQVGTDANGNPIFARDPFPNNQIPSNMLNPSAEAIAAHFYPAPNYDAPYTGAINYINTQSLQTNTDQFGVRIDANLPGNTALFARFSLSNGTKALPSTIPLEPTNLLDNVRQAVVGITHSFGPSTVLDLRAQYLRVTLRLSSPIASQSFLTSTGLAIDYPGQVGIGPIQPNINIAGAATIARSGPTDDGPANGEEYNGILTKTVGKHTVGVGASLYHLWIYDNCAYADATFDNLPTADPSNVGTTGSGLASFLLGIPSNADREEGDASMELAGNYYGAFVNDEWKATPNLTVTAGLRYDYAAPLQEVRGNMSSLDWANSTPDHTIWDVAKGAKASFPIAPSGLMASGVPYTVQYVPNGLFYPDRKDWAPRFGFAYRLPHDAVIRGGYGIFYDFNQAGIQKSQEIMGQWPFGFPSFTPGNLNVPTAASLTPANILGVNMFPPFVPSVVPPANPGFAVNRHDRTPYMQQWNLGIDKSFGSSWLVSVTYVGTKGTRLTGVPAFNISPNPGPAPVATQRRLPQFGTVIVQGDWYNSSYNGAQVKIEKRFTNGVSVLVSYSYSKCLDEISSTFGTSQPGTGIQDPFHPDTNRGLCDFDLTHNLVINSVYDLPFGPGKRFLNDSGNIAKYLFGGWQITGIVSANNGFPFSLSAGADVANVGTSSGQRPSISGPLLPSGFHQTVQEWFDTSNVYLQQYTYGDLGRNTIRQDKFLNFDFGLFKHIPIRERANIEFRSEFFNIFNHANFGAPDANFQDLSFGQVLTTVGNPRVVQFGLKLQF